MQEVQGLVIAVLCLKFFIILSLFPCGTCKVKWWGFNLIYWPEKCFGLCGGVFGFCRLYLAEVVGLKKVVVLDAASSSCKLDALYKLLFVSPSTPSGTLTMLRLASSSLITLFMKVGLFC